MGSVPMKSREEKLIQRVNNKQRRIIYDKWKYEIIQCYITFDQMEEKNTLIGFNNNAIVHHSTDKE
jgi:hypothetical protein